MSEPAPILEYAGPRADEPEGTRLVLERTDGGGVRFTDPPVGWGGVLGNIATCVGGLAFALYYAAGTIGRYGWALNAPAALVRLGVAVGVAGLAVLMGVEARRRATAPMVIEASAEGGLRVVLPTLVGGRSAWRTGALWDVRAGMAVPTLRGAIVSTLLIIPRWGLGVRILENRDAREVRWVARELRRALGLPERDA